MSDFRCSEKQTEIMRCIVEAEKAGNPLSPTKLKATLSYGAGVSIQAIQSSIRYLEKHGLLRREFHRGGTRLRSTSYAAKLLPI